MRAGRRAAAALVEGDTARLVELSYADTFVCDDLPAGMFPDCSPGATLEGHAVTGADGKISVLAADDYEARLADLGEVTVTGVGTCGPDDPDRRSYHLAFWAADEGGSLELVRREGEWSIGIVYADSLERWETVYADPETELACGNVEALGLDGVREVDEVPVDAEALGQLAVSARTPRVSVA